MTINRSVLNQLLIELIDGPALLGSQIYLLGAPHLVKAGSPDAVQAVIDACRRRMLIRSVTVDTCCLGWLWVVGHDAVVGAAGARALRALAP
jgi:hypothetical protein